MQRSNRKRSIKHRLAALHGRKNFLNFKALLVTILTSLLVSPALAEVGIGGFEDEEPLLPEQAFVLSTSVVDANTIRAEWNITDKYYLYRDKFKFVSETPGINPKPGIYPKGKIKEDEFFGKVETYRGKIAIDIPLERTSPATTLSMKITSQGCADMGICYPPQTTLVTFTLPPVATSSDVTAAPATPKPYLCRL